MNLLQFKSATAKRAGRLSRGNIVSASAVASAQNLALAYLQDKRYLSNDHRVDTLIRRESSKYFASGFLAGIGGEAVLPAGVAASLGASWFIQTRTVAAIAMTRFASWAMRWLAASIDKSGPSIPHGLGSCDGRTTGAHVVPLRAVVA